MAKMKKKAQAMPAADPGPAELEALMASFSSISLTSSDSASDSGRGAVDTLTAFLDEVFGGPDARIAFVQALASANGCIAGGCVSGAVRGAIR
jgi:hypothetical protein